LRRTIERIFWAGRPVYRGEVQSLHVWGRGLWVAQKSRVTRWWTAWTYVQWQDFDYHESSWLISDKLRFCSPDHGIFWELCFNWGFCEEMEIWNYSTLFLSVMLFYQKFQLFWLTKRLLREATFGKRDISIEISCFRHANAGILHLRLPESTASIDRSRQIRMYNDIQLHRIA
jgi:hypothetical protein